MSHIADRTSIEAAIELATGRPELVVVDARVLRLLMGDLSRLIILDVVAPSGPGAFRGVKPPDDEPFFWDDIDPCEEG